MAKFNHGPLSRAKKKLGGVVFQQYDGLQVGHEYQPNVTNPKTEAQVQTRLRFKLSSQINSLLAPLTDIIMKANGVAYKRYQRGKTTAMLFRKTYIDEYNVAQIAELPNYRTTNPTGVTFSASASQASDGAPVVVTITREDATAALAGIAQIMNLDSDGARGSTTKALFFNAGENSITFSLTGGSLSRTFGIVMVMTPETEATGVIGYQDAIGSKTLLAELGRIVSVSTGTAMSNSVQLVAHYTPAS